MSTIQAGLKNLPVQISMQSQLLALDEKNGTETDTETESVDDEIETIKTKSKNPPPQLQINRDTVKKIETNIVSKNNINEPNPVDEIPTAEELTALGYGDDPEETFLVFATVVRSLIDVKSNISARILQHIDEDENIDKEKKKKLKFLQSHCFKKFFEFIEKNPNIGLGEFHLKMRSAYEDAYKSTYNKECEKTYSGELHENMVCSFYGAYISLDQDGTAFPVYLRKMIESIKNIRKLGKTEQDLNQAFVKILANDNDNPELKQSFATGIIQWGYSILNIEAKKFIDEDHPDVKTTNSPLIFLSSMNDLFKELAKNPDKYFQSRTSVAIVENVEQDKVKANKISEVISEKNDNNIDDGDKNDNNVRTNKHKKNNYNKKALRLSTYRNVSHMPGYVYDKDSNGRIRYNWIIEKKSYQPSSTLDVNIIDDPNGRKEAVFEELFSEIYRYQLVIEELIRCCVGWASTDPDVAEQDRAAKADKLKLILEGLYEIIPLNDEKTPNLEQFKDIMKKKKNIEIADDEIDYVSEIFFEAIDNDNVLCRLSVAAFEQCLKVLEGTPDLLDCALSRLDEIDEKGGIIAGKDVNSFKEQLKFIGEKHNGDRKRFPIIEDEYSKMYEIFDKFMKKYDKTTLDGIMLIYDIIAGIEEEDERISYNPNHLRIHKPTKEETQKLYRYYSNVFSTSNLLSLSSIPNSKASKHNGRYPSNMTQIRLESTNLSISTLASNRSEKPFLGGPTDAISRLFPSSENVSSDDQVQAARKIAHWIRNPAEISDWIMNPTDKKVNSNYDTLCDVFFSLPYHPNDEVKEVALSELLDLLYHPNGQVCDAVLDALDQCIKYYAVDEKFAGIRAGLYAGFLAKLDERRPVNQVVDSNQQVRKEDPKQQVCNKQNEEKGKSKGARDKCEELLRSLIAPDDKNPQGLVTLTRKFFNEKAEATDLVLLVDDGRLLSVREMELLARDDAAKWMKSEKFSLQKAAYAGVIELPSGSLDEISDKKSNSGKKSKFDEILSRIKTMSETHGENFSFEVFDPVGYCYLTCSYATRELFHCKPLSSAMLAFVERLEKENGYQQVKDLSNKLAGVDNKVPPLLQNMGLGYLYMQYSLSSSDDFADWLAKNGVSQARKQRLRAIQLAAMELDPTYLEKREKQARIEKEKQEQMKVDKIKEMLELNKV